MAPDVTCAKQNGSENSGEEKPQKISGLENP
jgi:hypothetical protein